MKDIKKYINESQVDESLAELVTGALSIVVSSAIYAFYYWYSENYFDKHFNSVYGFFAKNFNKFQLWLYSKRRDKILIELAKDKDYQEFIKNNQPNEKNFAEWREKVGELFKQKLSEEEYKEMMKSDK